MDAFGPESTTAIPGCLRRFLQQLGTVVRKQNKAAVRLGKDGENVTVGIKKDD
jgi:hypothetical protein